MQFQIPNTPRWCRTSKGQNATKYGKVLAIEISAIVRSLWPRRCRDPGGQKSALKHRNRWKLISPTTTIQILNAGWIRFFRERFAQCRFEIRFPAGRRTWEIG